MTAQLDLDFAIQRPVYMTPSLVRCRDRAVGKPLPGRKRWRGEWPDREELLVVMREDGARMEAMDGRRGLEFEFLAVVFDTGAWSDVFRALLWLRARGEVAYLGEDMWAVPS